MSHDFSFLEVFFPYLDFPTPLSPIINIFNVVSMSSSMCPSLKDALIVINNDKNPSSPASQRILFTVQLVQIGQQWERSHSNRFRFNFLPLPPFSIDIKLCIFTNCMCVCVCDMSTIGKVHIVWNKVLLLNVYNFNLVVRNAKNKDRNLTVT